MRRTRVVVTAGIVTAWLGATTSAQTQPGVTSELSPLQVAVACAPPASMSGEPAHALHVIGAQDTTSRQLLGARDLLIVGGGTKAGVQLGQTFFVRREMRFGTAYGVRSSKQRAAPGARTVAWIRIVAVNDSTAIALVEGGCGDILTDDYLEPFVAPVIPDGADRDVTSGEPDFTSLGRVLAGNEDRTVAGAGDFMLIDRGSAQGAAPGARYAVYRDVKASGLPLASIGELVVISTGPDTSLARITRARDAVFTGDYIAQRR
jgi:hypothetical protein